MRPSFRQPNELRSIKFTRHYIKHPEGSVLVEFGETKVLCNASIVEGVPKFLKDSKQGWLTAEYDMLPRSTHTRMERDRAAKVKGRTHEIQRLIGRSLRNAMNLDLLTGYTIMVDCDVIQADGGTRTASITGACVALYDAVQSLQDSGKIKQNPFNYLIAGVSVGIYQGVPVLDLDYQEDCQAETDMTLVMNEALEFIEIQGTAEKKPFQGVELERLLELGKEGINLLINEQKKALEID